jgi:F420 biosynthesis protein FbiB-like protein
LDAPGDKTQALYKLIRERRSVRSYTQRPVERALIERLLTAALWAPSAHNRQPWRFGVIEGADTKERLADAMNTQLRADLVTDGLPADQIQAQVTRRRNRLTRAPVLVLLCVTMSDMHHYPDEKRRRAEWTMATQSLALAGQNLLLAAHSEGLGACWLCAPLFCADVVRKTLDLPWDWEPQAFISLGWPGESPQKDRESLNTRVKYLR